MKIMFRGARVIMPFLLLSLTATAGMVRLSLDTSMLVAHPAGLFFAAFVFLDGNGFGDGNNTVTIANVSYGGGIGLGSPLLAGSVTGSLETGIVMTDSSFFNLFEEEFLPGAQ